MTVCARAKPITAEDFERFDPEWRYDLVEGVLTPMPPLPGFQHGVVAYNLAWVLGAFVRQHNMGACTTAETRFVVQRDPDTVLAPDWAFVRASRLPHDPPEGLLELAPDMVLEVRSPSDRLPDIQRKISLWLRSGVRLVWELDPKARILTAYRPDGSTADIGVDDVLTGEDVLPGFEYALRELFT